MIKKGEVRKHMSVGNDAYSDDVEDVFSHTNRSAGIVVYFR